MGRAVAVGGTDHSAREQRAEKLHDLRSSQPSSQHNNSVGIDAVNLEDLFRQVETNGANLHRGRFLPSVVTTPSTLA